MPSLVIHLDFPRFHRPERFVDLRQGHRAGDHRIEIEPALKKKNGQGFAAAMLFFGMINWTHTWFDPKGPVSTGALAEMAVDLTLGGLGRAGA